MGCRILVGKEAGTDHEYAAFFCSTSMVAFGPLFDGAGDPNGCNDPHDEAEAFLEWLKYLPPRADCLSAVHLDLAGDIKGSYSDPRSHGADLLSGLYGEFRKEVDARKAVAQ